MKAAEPATSVVRASWQSSEVAKRHRLVRGRVGKVTLAMLAGLLLLGCTERPQSADGTARKSDQKAWHQPVNKDDVVKGWNTDDQASWEQQMRIRVQGQNEYARAAAKP